MISSAGCMKRSGGWLWKVGPAEVITESGDSVNGAVDVALFLSCWQPPHRGMPYLVKKNIYMVLVKFKYDFVHNYVILHWSNTHHRIRIFCGRLPKEYF